MIYDEAADDATQVEIQWEAGLRNRVKLYIHRKGVTEVRLCKLRPDNITITEGIVPFIQLD